jgi:hypothetical protein
MGNIRSLQHLGPPTMVHQNVAALTASHRESRGVMSGLGRVDHTQPLPPVVAQTTEGASSGA